MYGKRASFVDTFTSLWYVNSLHDLYIAAVLLLSFTHEKQQACMSL